MPDPSLPTPDTTSLMLATVADLYRQEVGAEEDVHRSLPFFGTALGIVIAALAYAAGRLPRWPGGAGHAAPDQAAFDLAAALLALALIEAGCVLVWLARAIARRDYARIGPEDSLQARLDTLRAFHAAAPPADRDRAVAEDMRWALIASYAAITPINRALNARRQVYRARAGSHLLRSLIWALSATSVIFMADKFGFLP